MVISKPIGNSAHGQRAKILYENAFPKEEQLPWWLLRLMTALRLTELNCYECDGVFCGLTVMRTTPKVQFVMFFAVEESLRGQGYGSSILELLKGERPVILNVEPLDDQAQNAAQASAGCAFMRKTAFGGRAMRLTRWAALSGCCLLSRCWMYRPMRKYSGKCPSVFGDRKFGRLKNEKRQNYGLAKNLLP